MFELDPTPAETHPLERGFVDRGQVYSRIAMTAFHDLSPAPVCRLYSRDQWNRLCPDRD
jgi:hypothetical protein